MARMTISAISTRLFGAVLFCATFADIADAKVLHVFGEMQGDGIYPEAGVLIDKKGNIYGSTTFDNDAGNGTIFELPKHSAFKTLYTFDGPSGNSSYSRLIMDAEGNLYGTTASGGQHSFGTIFKLAPDGTETVLHSFTGGDEGSIPQSGLIADKSGNFYGTAGNVIYSITPDGSYSVLHTFDQDKEGILPSVLWMDSAGNLFGTNEQGGKYSQGTVFEFTLGGKLQVLHSFKGTSEGAEPFGGVVGDQSGNLYGTTAVGGDASCRCGTVFKIAATGEETIIHNFSGDKDGANPHSPLVFDTAGFLIGTTWTGGQLDQGTLFRISTDGREKILHAFKGGSDGAIPRSGVTLYKGDIYGTTAIGGNDSCDGGGCGTIYRFKDR